MELMRTVEIED